MDEAMKQLYVTLDRLNDTLTVLVSLQDRHMAMVKEHQEWLRAHTRALAESDARLNRIELNLDRLTVLLLKRLGGNGHGGEI